ncbi:Spb1 C-terminal domain-containing protein [Polychytrium aggregatum]|uniref:Spb1 C-terminal domain-containing protein n=1 Tax=Polychytrium aggregatum TaxID=110093 RepID=UPI0022FE5DEB|nr:Spb1 C-terminal domain-containing protein [Polychytrium aggregatum]KAI9207785.1 Spb1 C-terminal domain-containing protein [Polychytrium aggregatum]
MGIVKKHAKGRLDKYYHMAKEQGYRARSAFKLIQLNKKYNFLEKAKVLVDLCAAPGGWLQVAAKYMPKPNIIIGLDLAPIRPIPGVITFVEDITTAKCRTTIKAELKTWKADVFLHDGAPNVGTAWLQDAFQQSELVLASLKLATEFLGPNGTFVTKVFRSKDYNKLMWVFNQLFSRVEATKPASSRNVSAEIFVVCQGYLAPKKIDPKILDPKYVFKEVDDVDDAEDEKKTQERHNAILNDLFHPEKRRRHRDGYEDNDYTLHKSNSVTEFIEGKDFIPLLARSHELSFKKDENGKIYEKHPLTTEEIKECLSDLRVLGKKDFKTLLKWREEIRVSCGLDKSRQQKRQEAEEKARLEAETSQDKEEDVEDEVQRQSNLLNTQLKRQMRKVKDKRAKQLLKMQMGMTTPMDIGLEAEHGIGGLDVDDGSGLFDWKKVGDASNTLGKARRGEFEEFESDESDDAAEDDDDEEDEVLDSDEETAQKVQWLENDLDQMYENYKSRKLEKDPKAKVAQQKEGAKAKFEEWYGSEYDKSIRDLGKDDDDDEEGGERQGSDDDSEYSSWGDESEDERKPTKKGAAVKIGAKRTKPSADSEDEDQDDAPQALSKKAKLFFDNPIFKKSTELGQKPKPDQKGKNTKNKSKPKGMFDADLESESDDEVQANPLQGFSDDENEFEVVKGDEVGPDKDPFAITNAVGYTLAQQMASAKGKRDLLDDSFNRYTFNDREGLPEWFLKEEERFNKPQMPVTKEAVEIMRQRMLALNARPIKKIAEAKFRKKMRTLRRLEKSQRKAEGLAENEELSEKSKLEQITKLMDKAKSKSKLEKPKIKLVVARGAHRGVQGRPKGVKGKYKMVDPRMKKEVRAEKRKAKESKSRRRK